MASYGARLLAAYRGRPTDLSPQIQALDDELVRGGDGYVTQVAS